MTWFNERCQIISSEVMNSDSMNTNENNNIIQHNKNTTTHTNSTNTLWLLLLQNHELSVPFLSELALECA